MVANDDQRLGGKLLQQGVLTADQLGIALKEQQHSGLLLGQQLVHLGFVTDTAIQQALEAHLGHKVILMLDRVVADNDALALVPEELARRLKVFPLSWDVASQVLVLAMQTPSDVMAQDLIQSRLARPVILDVYQAAASDILAAIDMHYGNQNSVDDIADELEHNVSHDVSGPLSEQPVVRLIDAFLMDAVRSRASDLHFSPEQGFIRVRYRIDGVLQQVRCLHKRHWPAMLVRLKVMTDMNIAETRAPQDGRMSMLLLGRMVDFRASVFPTRHGENVVLRVLDRYKKQLSLSMLDVPDYPESQLKALLRQVNGLILVCGPTGSGKTTTLYAMLGELSHMGVHIMTLEDPVEYPVPLIRQTSISDAVKLDFVSGIRAMMRQDPDVMLIGEVRDDETAAMSFRAAMTGHLVLSSLHAHSVVGVIARLKELGISHAAMAGQIKGIIAQRLLRKLCPVCKTGYTANEDEIAALGVSGEGASPVLFRAVGCRQCHGTGYQGRFPLMEVLIMDDELAECLEQQVSQLHLHRIAVKKGMQTLARQAQSAVLHGLTSLEEASRVVVIYQGMV
ncbi:GspE/PulE family protein [Leeia oryzae]|uniref:GspE/PulE family protein n=1 Tax=Leeia oryzae TaxID=356662 RepID=UPI00036296A0|nr:GspE/PulE family protein [Leeia oryzae]